MAMQTDVKPGICPPNATTVVFEGRTRWKGGYLSYSTTATVLIKDGGTNVFSFTAPGVAGTGPIYIPGEGVLCSSNLTVVTSAGSNVTVFYG
jgi:hypothetical protein